MIHLTTKLPEDNQFFVACSGGVDSMAVLHWLSKGSRKPYGIIHVHHNTGSYADAASKFVGERYKDYCDNFFLERVTSSPPKGTSKESWWREQRYTLFDKVIRDTKKDYPIILAHNLDDCVEQYIISTTIRIKRHPIISYRGPSNTIRPFRTWPKKEIIAYAQRNGLQWLEDPSNTNTNFVRNKVRHEVLPMIAKINPGIYSHVKRLIIHEDLQGPESRTTFTL